MTLFSRRKRNAITAEDAAAQLDRGETLLLDVRESAEWQAGHAPGATYMPLGTLRPGDLPPESMVVTVCRSGHRSQRAAKQLAQAGIEVRNLDGGMTAWAAAGFPVVRDDGSPGSVR